MITIKHNESPIITPCKMLCDEVLHDKLNNYELTTFMNSHETNLFIGTGGVGFNYAGLHPSA